MPLNDKALKAAFMAWCFYEGKHRNDPSLDRMKQLAEAIEAYETARQKTTGLLALPEAHFSTASQLAALTGLLCVIDPAVPDGTAVFLDAEGKEVGRVITGEPA